MIQDVLLSARQRFHYAARLCDVSGVQEENSSPAVFSRIPLADFPFKIELHRRTYLGRHDGDEQHYLSDIRTAAAGALAARTLAPRHISTAAVLGAGVQAYWQVRALYHERKFENLLLWARNPLAADRLSARLRSGFSDISITVCDDIEEVVRRCDVLMTATQAREPLVRGEWLHPGQHITAVGADDPAKCELDSVALNRARVFADSVDTVCANGDLHRWIASGAYARERIAGEIGDVLAGTKPGREKSTDITIAKFVGIGAQDLVAARVTLERLGTLAAVEN